MKDNYLRTPVSFDLDEAYTPSSLLDESLGQIAGYLLCGVGGCVFASTWFFLMLTPASGSLWVPFNQELECLLRVAFLIFIAVGQICQRVFFPRLSFPKDTPKLACIGAIFTLCAPAVAVFAIPFQIALLCWCIAGVGYTLFLLLQFNFLSTITSHTRMKCIPIIFATAALFSCLIFFLSPAALRLLIIATLPIVSACLMLLNKSMSLSVGICGISEGVVSLSISDFLKITGPIFCLALCLGFGAYMITSAGVVDPVWAIAGTTFVVFVIGITVAVYAVMERRSIMSSRNQFCLIVPFVIVSLAPMFFVDANGVLLCCCILLAVFIPQEIISVSTVSEKIRYESGSTAFYAYSLNRGANALGLAAGYALCYIALSLEPFFGIQGPLAIVLSIILFTAILMSFLLSDHYRIVSKEPVKDADNDATYPASLVNEQETVAQEYASWRKRCDAFSQSIGLSPRQHDVFMFLAHGHNASFIERKLVISNHTVKSHTYSIYQKAQVHSRQELIEKIEDFSGSASEL